MSTQEAESILITLLAISVVVWCVDVFLTTAIEDDEDER